MDQPDEKLPGIAEVAAMQAALSRKFEATDVDDTLYQAAATYARLYDGDFPYMLSTAPRKLLASY